MRSADLHDDRDSPPKPAGSHDTPFGKGLWLGRYAGIPVLAHWSVLLILGLLTVTLATYQLPAMRSGEPTWEYWLLGVLGAVLFLLSLLAHELAHAVVAIRFGMRVERMTVWVLGGLTELDGEPPTPRADAAIAAAGPLTSACIAALSGLIATAIGIRTAMGATFLWLCAMSVVLAAFNLLPGAPLDGGRLLRALLWGRSGDRVRAAENAATVGRFVGIWLAVLGGLTMLAGDPTGLWLMFVGWFIVQGARSEAYAGRVERLGGLVVGDVMVASPVVSPSWWTIREFLNSLDPAHVGQAVFPVVDIEGKAVGGITIADLERQRRATADQARMSDLLTHRPPVLVVARDMPLSQLLLPMHVRGHVAVVVDVTGRPIGTVDEQSLARATSLKHLGWGPAESASDSAPETVQ